MSTYALDWLNNSAAIHSSLNLKALALHAGGEIGEQGTSLFMFCLSRLHTGTFIFPKTSFVFLCGDCCLNPTPTLTSSLPPQLIRPGVWGRLEVMHHHLSLSFFAECSLHIMAKWGPSLCIDVLAQELLLWKPADKKASSVQTRDPFLSQFRKRGQLLYTICSPDNVLMLSVHKWA